MSRWSTVLAILVMAAGLASAQAPLPFSETFDGGALPAGWTEAHTSVAATPVKWSVDATPALAPAPGGPTFGGSAGSLNYNDGVDYDDAATNSGSATSPAIDTTAAAGNISVSFQCNYQTETTGGTFDVRSMDILDGTTSAVIATRSFTGTGGSNPPSTTCAAMGTWHLHTMTIAIGAATSVKVRFNFNTVDSIGNTFAGWFIDNLNVTCTDLIAPSVPILLTPPTAAIVGQAPATVLLDWGDSTDTNSCGPGTVSNYQVEVALSNPPVAPFAFTATPAVSTVTTGPLAAGVYFWQVRAVDASGNVSGNSAVFSFTVEPPLPPLAPDTLFVNTSVNGAQFGDPGFVDPVVDENPVFSAIYRDGNTVDSALAIQYQVSDDPTFTLVTFDSGVMGISPTLPKDSRCTDLTINVDLQRATVYYWRCRFTDNGGLTGPYSIAQTFRIGDDYDFGVREGSTHHGRRCYVATAAWGSGSSEVAGLQAFRSTTLEASGAGREFSRWYATAGASLSAAVGSSDASRSAARATLAPLAWLASHSCSGLMALALMIGLGIFGCRRSIA